MRREFRFASYRLDRQRRRPTTADGRRLASAPRGLAIGARCAAGVAAGLVVVASLHANTLVSARADRATGFLVYAVHVGELLGEPELEGPEAACQAAIAARLAQRTPASPGRWIPVRVVF
jgi:hypothetical protein